MMNKWRAAFPKSIMSIFLVVLCVYWARKELLLFSEKALPRLVQLKVWPKGSAVFTKSRVERMNISMPDFTAIARAISSEGQNPEIFQKCANYHQYVLDAFPGRFDAFLVKGVCEYRLGRADEAEASFKKALLLNPAYFWSYYNLGMLYFNAGMRDASAQFLKEAIRYAPAFNEQRLVESKIFRDIIYADKAVQPRVTFRKAFLDARRAVSAGCIFASDFSCAREEAEQAIREEPSVDLWLLAGVASYQLKDYVAAERYLSRVVEADAASGAGHFFLALAFKENGDAGNFVRHYQQAIGLGFDIRSFLVGIKFPLRIY